MGGEATFPDGLACFVHHCLERGISFDFVQAIFHVGVNTWMASRSTKLRLPSR